MMPVHSFSPYAKLSKFFIQCLAGRVDLPSFMRPTALPNASSALARIPNLPRGDLEPGNASAAPANAKPDTASEVSS